MTGDPDARSLRWNLVDEEAEQAQAALFADESGMRRHVGTGEYRGLEFLEVNAKRVINQVPKASQMPFRHTINAYRGCSHACSYCMSGDTLVLMADGRSRCLAELRVGDEIVGTQRVGNYRRYVKTTVLDHWTTVKQAWRVRLADGTELIASGDHRFLTERGWKFVSPGSTEDGCRPHLTTNNRLLGIGHFASPLKHDESYRTGYLCGLLRGDATIGRYQYERLRGGAGVIYSFRLALADAEPLDRAEAFLADFGVPTRRRPFTPATERRRAITAIHNARKADHSRILELIEWPADPPPSWLGGFLAGIFDAEGCCSRGVLRISNTDAEIHSWIRAGMEAFSFDAVLEGPGTKGVANCRLRGGLAERLRFFMTVDPAITRKRTIEGFALKSNVDLRVRSIEDLHVDIPMFDITTGTGDFIADGVVSHNCFARPTHEYLGLGIGEDFDRKIVVKVNAVERTATEVRSPKWSGEHIAMGTNTDPYQKAEGKYHLTRGIIEVLGEARNPFSILTKSTLALRDLDVMVEAAKRTSVRMNFSIGTLDRSVWRLTEPGTPRPDKRVEAVKRFNDAGIPCGVLMGPVLPGLSDSTDQLKEVVDACVAAGAVSISAIGLHLRPGVREHFLASLEPTRPDLVRLYQQRFTGPNGPRAYQPKAAQEALAGRVRRLVRAAESGRGPVRTVEATFDVRRRLAEQGLGPSEPATASAPAAEQLTLL